MELKFTIPGEPKGKARPRVVKGHAFTPKSTAEYEELVQQCYRINCGVLRFQDDEPIELTIFAYFSEPEKETKKIRERKLLLKWFPIKKPDVDNIGKIICDALNGIAYRDDSQIVTAHIFKRYSPRPKVSVYLDSVRGDPDL